MRSCQRPHGSLRTPASSSLAARGCGCRMARAGASHPQRPLAGAPGRLPRASPRVHRPIPGPL
eukprot:2034597-Alexandrium_andersonii.AAC.1